MKIVVKVWGRAPEVFYSATSIMSGQVLSVITKRTSTHFPLSSIEYWYEQESN